MKLRRVLAYTLVLACGSVAVLSAFGADWWRLLRRSPYESTDLTPTVAGKRCSYERDDSGVPGCQYLIAERSIAEANEREPAATWAGNYWRGDGYTTYLLTLSADGRVISRYTWDAGGSDTYYGELQHDGNRVHVNLAVPSHPQGHRLLEFVLVRWGARRYLVEMDELGAFVNTINRTDLDSRPRRSWFLLHEGDEAAATCGRPELPGPWSDRLRESAQQGRVLAVTKTGTHGRTDEWSSMPMGPPPPPPERDVYRVRMQAGRAEGVFEGQEFSWNDDDSHSSLDGMVTTLGEHEAELEVERQQFCPAANCVKLMPKVGMLLVSSRKPPVFLACH